MRGCWPVPIGWAEMGANEQLQLGHWHLSDLVEPWRPAQFRLEAHDELIGSDQAIRWMPALEMTT